MDCTAWRFWMMRQLNDCSMPAPRSSAAKQWIVATDSNDEEASHKNIESKSITVYFTGKLVSHFHAPNATSFPVK